jgi:hypothetical protein
LHRVRRWKRAGSWRRRRRRRRRKRRKRRRRSNGQNTTMTKKKRSRKSPTEFHACRLDKQHQVDLETVGEQGQSL